MIDIIFTDTHFGVRQNSINWLNSQLDFVYNQFIPYIKNIKQDKVRVIHLGDVFDSRSTISTYIAKETVKVFKSIREVCSEFIIVAGNHDYYSPDSDEVCSLDLFFNNLDIKILYNDFYVQDDYLYLPWYEYLNTENVHNIINQLNIKKIFTHADIISSPIPYKGIEIYSGHTHIPYIKGDIKNLGSCFALNFSDSNSPRGFYKLENNKLYFIENERSIKFYKLHNEEIFTDKLYNKNDYIELYINKENIIKEEYLEKISELSLSYKNLWVIPCDKNISESNIEFEGYDIEKIIEESIPTELMDKFRLVLNKANN